MTYMGPTELFRAYQVWLFTKFGLVSHFYCARWLLLGGGVDPSDPTQLLLLEWLLHVVENRCS